MSSQPSTSFEIPFSLTTPPQSFRLLELPPELLELIASAGSSSAGGDDGAPLRLTSAPALPSGQGEGRANRGEQLHLCTADRAWSVRQVSTSNSIFVTGPAGVGGWSGSSGAEMDLDNAPSSYSSAPSQSNSGITAIAQVGSVLELVPLQSTLADVEEQIRLRVPIYDPLSTGSALRNGSSVHPLPTTPQQVTHDIPAPTTLVRQAMDRLCVFESRGRVYIPSTQTLLDVWKKIVEGCAIRGIRLDRPFSWKAVVDAMLSDGDGNEDEDMYGAATTGTTGEDGVDNVHRLIATTLFTHMFPALQLVDTPTSPHPNPASSRPEPSPMTLALHPAPTTRFLGQLLLPSHSTPSSPSDSAAFGQQWRALLPEAWWGLCDEDDLLAAGSGDGVPNGAGASKDTAAAAANAGAGKKMGKWHEKFAAQRKAGR